MHRVYDQSPTAFIKHDPDALIYAHFDSPKLIEQAQALVETAADEPDTAWKNVESGLVQCTDTFPAGGTCEFPQQVTHNVSVTNNGILYVGGSISLPRERDPDTLTLLQGHDATMPIEPFTLEIEVTPERLMAHLIGSKARLVERDRMPLTHTLVLDSLVYTLGLQERPGYRPAINRIPMLAALFDDNEQSTLWQWSK